MTTKAFCIFSSITSNIYLYLYYLYLYYLYFHAYVFAFLHFVKLQLGFETDLAFWPFDLHIMSNISWCKIIFFMTEILINKRAEICWLQKYSPPRSILHLFPITALSLVEYVSISVTHHILPILLSKTDHYMEIKVSYHVKGFLLVPWVLPTSQKHGYKRIGYAKSWLGETECGKVV